MEKTVCSLLVGYGGLVAILGLLTQHLAPDLARLSLLAGVSGGGLSVLWGLLGLLGKPHRRWAVFTMAVTGLVLLSQVVTHWLPSGEPKPGTLTLALLATVMLLATLGMLMAVTHTSVPGSATASGDTSGGNPPYGRNPPGPDTPELWSRRPLSDESPSRLMERAGSRNRSTDINLSIDLLLYGVMLIGFSALARRQVPNLSGTTPIAGLVGGVLSVFWGMRGLLGFRGRVGATVTLAVLTIVLFALAVNAWLTAGAGVANSKLVALILTVLLMITVVQLANFIQASRGSPANSETNAAGVASERDPSQVADK